MFKSLITSKWDALASRANLDCSRPREHDRCQLATYTGRGLPSWDPQTPPRATSQSVSKPRKNKPYAQMNLRYKQQTRETAV